jgi:CysZ protein
MSAVMQALLRAGANLREPRILALVLLPVLGSLLLWTVLAWVFWDAWTGFVAGTLRTTAAAGWLQDWSARWVIDYTAVLAVLVAILPAMLVTALVITEIFAMPVIVGFVAGRYYPGLSRAAGGSVAGSIANALVAIAIFAALWVFTLPLWLTGIGAVLAPVLTSAYLNQRIFRHDALAEHASRDEYVQVVRDSRGELFLLGILLSLLLYVPLVNLLVPVLSGMAFTHYCLARLNAQRVRV